ncbi:gluconokinase [Arthrobacter pigmenti]|uniref:Gluconokinase n=1 Tax=Arthrobacter pigmenti TaxID=271432 RepID=A0A846RUM7_9MICC|nr:gluconokinase [Arthrobacter pigmenti]NJC24222.1 gluconokinase [Arthrobacter pigmenti]
METRMHLVIMGISGSGKTTIATALSKRLGWSYAEADEFHSAENITKMTQGIALTDEDRHPWLTAIQEWVSSKSAVGESTIVTCSALKRSYRDILAAADGDVRFVHLLGDVELIRSRLKTRTGHFMPESLLPSQVSTLEPLGENENGITVMNVGTPHEVTDSILQQLGLAA